MESLTYSPFLHRSSLRARSHVPARPSPSKPKRRYYGKPQDTFEDLQATVKAQFEQLESDMRVYLTEVEDRVDLVNATTGRIRVNSKSPSKLLEDKKTKTAFFPDIVKAKSATLRNRSTSEEPKHLRLQPSKPLHTALFKPQKKDSLVDLLAASNGFEEDFEHIESVVEKLKADRSELPAPCLEDLLVEVLTRHQLHAAYKQAVWPSADDTSDPLIVFSKACDEMKVTPVPALAKISGAKLVLNRYQLQAGLCEAIGRTLPILSNLRVVHLDANAISDIGGYALLLGIHQHGKISSFYYTRNEVGLKVVEALKEMRNGEISDLSLRGCKVNLRALRPLITAVLQLREVMKLCLAEIGLSDGGIHELVAGLRRSRVINLDISWNQLSLNATKVFLTYLRKDKKLQYLDYSWNSLASSDNEVAYLIGAILRNHPCLLHLNIGNTQLNDQAVVLIVQGLKKSNTMVSLHLTGNQIEQRTVEFLKRHLDARSETQMLSHSCHSRPAPLLAQSFPSFSPRKADTSITNIKVRDCYGHQIVSHRDNLVNIFLSDERRGNAVGESQIVTRLLGHQEVPNGEQWVYSEHCWVCERWPIFTFTIKESSLKIVDSVDILSCRGCCSSKLTLKASFNNWQDLSLQHTIGEEHATSLLLPPGMHKFWLIRDSQCICTSASFRTIEEAGVKLNQVLIPIRTVDLQLLEATKTEKIRSFDKDKSVFKAFVEDTDAVVSVMFANDMKFSKISRVIKNEGDLNQVTSVLKQNFSEIKAIFDQTSAISNYPSISWLHFSDFCTMCQVVDKKFLNTAAIDRLFIAVNVELVEQDDNPDRELCRFEFFEIMVRMAVCKYQDLPLTPAEALRKLLNEHILKYGAASSALQFRHEKLYHVEVNDILEVNLFNLQTLFAKYKDRRGKYVNIEGIKTLLDRARVAYNEKDLMRDFVFSKMSILDESTANGAHEKMVFVEFLEFIGRFSESSITEEISLHAKIERLLDAMFPPHGLKRKPVSDLEDEDDSPY